MHIKIYRIKILYIVSMQYGFGTQLKYLLWACRVISDTATDSMATLHYTCCLHSTKHDVNCSAKIQNIPNINTIRKEWKKHV